MKLCIVSSCGGHLTEIRCLKPVYDAHEHFYVLNDRVTLPHDMNDKTYFITHSERDWKFFLNLWEAYKILNKEGPDVILSTGAGPVVPFAIIGRFLFGVRVIFIETITRIYTPSLTGRIMYWLSHIVFYQWQTLDRYFKKGIYGSPLL